MADSRSPARAPLKARALYEQVADRLREDIFSRRLQPGSWIDELKLAAELGISRTPLRERRAERARRSEERRVGKECRSRW
mgnify:CR=1 FL=1